MNYSNLDINSSFSYSNPAPRERVSLNLSDLDAGDDRNKSASRSPEVEPDGIDYKNELAKLLAKSRGTAYEKTLKRFVESKYREIQLDELERSTKSGPIDLASLSSSKYDTPRKSSVLESSVLTSVQKQSRIENMASPLERNKWKGPENPHNTSSTNHIGRQRPSPMKESPYHIHTNASSIQLVQPTNELGVRRSSSAERKAKSRIRSRSPQRFTLVEAAPASPSVSLSQFKQWHQQNTKWNNRKAEKVKNTRQNFEKFLAERSKPKIVSKSVRLAELANFKQSAAIYASLQSSAANSPTRGGGRDEDVLSEFDLPISASHDSEGLNAPFAAPEGLPLPEDLPAFDVYERLAARGRHRAQARLNWQPPPDNQTHKPVILESSRRMAHRRSLSADSRRSVSPNTEVKRVDRAYLLGTGMSRVLAAAATAEKERRGSLESSLVSGSVVHTSSTAGKQRSDSRSTLGAGSVSAVAAAGLVTSNLRLSDLLVDAAASTLVTGESAAVASDELPLPAESDAAADLDLPLPPGSPTGSLQSREGRSRSLSRDSRGGGRALSTDGASSVGTRDTRTLRSIDLRLLAQCGIERSRSLSASRRQAAVEKENRRNFIAADTVAKPFTPTLVAKESQRLVARSKTTFEERNLQSVEDKFIRNVISRRAESPGPGYYKPVKEGMTSPTRTRPSATGGSGQGVRIDRSVASPGRSGYSFGKAPLNRLQTTGGFGMGDGAPVPASAEDPKVLQLMLSLSDLGGSLKRPKL